MGIRMDVLDEFDSPVLVSDKKTDMRVHAPVTIRGGTIIGRVKHVTKQTMSGGAILTSALLLLDTPELVSPVIGARAAAKGEIELPVVFAHRSRYDVAMGRP